MPWPEPDPREIKVTWGEFFAAVITRVVLVALLVLILVLLFAPGLLS